MVVDVEGVKINAMANLPYSINGIMIYPISLKQIVQMGYDNYNNNLSLLSIRKDQLVSPEHLDSIPDDIEVYDIVYELYREDALSKAFNDCLSLFCQTQNIVYENGLFIEGIKVDSEIYIDILKVVHIQNGIILTGEEDFNPKSERVKMLKKKQLENRKKIQELKKDSGDGSDQLTFFDLISIICSNANGISVFNVFDLNMFQFNDQFNRMKLLNEYETSVQSILHGADPKNMEIKHWISKS